MFNRLTIIEVTCINTNHELSGMGTLTLLVIIGFLGMLILIHNYFKFFFH